MIESSVVDLYVSINHQRQGAQQQWKGQSFRIECSCLCIATLLLQTFYFSLSGGTRASIEQEHMFQKGLVFPCCCCQSMYRVRGSCLALSLASCCIVIFTLLVR